MAPRYAGAGPRGQVSRSLDTSAPCVNSVNIVAPESTRSRLLAAARDHYLEVGPAGFSLREVARRTSLTPAAIYRHYDGKDALLGAVCAEGFRVFASYLMTSLAEATPAARLRAAGQQYLRFGLERPRDYRVIFMREHEGAGELRIDPATLPPTFEFLVDRVRDSLGARPGRPRRGDDPRACALSIWAHVHGLVSLRLAGHLAEAGDDRAFTATYTRSVDALLAGLGL